MNDLIILWSILFILASLGSTMLIKIDQIFYNYDNYWVIMFFINICYPINILIYALKYNFKDLIKHLTKDFFKKTFAVSIIYTLETCALYYSIISIPLSIYIICRTSPSFFNIILNRFYAKKEINKYYYIGLIFLIAMYIILSFNIKKYNYDLKNIICTAVVFFSGFTTSLTNNIVEYHFLTIEDKTKYKYLYQIILNFYCYIIMFPISIYFLSPNKHILPNLIFSLAGISLQVFFLFKVFILSDIKISGSQLISALDLLRRIISNTISYIFLNEYYNIYIIISNVCMAISSLLILYSQYVIKIKNYNILESVSDSNIIEMKIIN